MLRKLDIDTFKKTSKAGDINIYTVVRNMRRYVLIVTIGEQNYMVSVMQDPLNDPDLLSPKIFLTSDEATDFLMAAGVVRFMVDTHHIDMKEISAMARDAIMAIPAIQAPEPVKPVVVVPPVKLSLWQELSAAFDRWKS